MPSCWVITFLLKMYAYYGDEIIIHFDYNILLYLITTFPFSYMYILHNMLGQLLVTISWRHLLLTLPGMLTFLLLPLCTTQNDTSWFVIQLCECFVCCQYSGKVLNRVRLTMGTCPIYSFPIVSFKLK